MKILLLKKKTHHLPDISCWYGYWYILVSLLWLSVSYDMANFFRWMRLLIYSFNMTVDITEMANDMFVRYEY